MDAGIGAHRACNAVVSWTGWGVDSSWGPMIEIWPYLYSGPICRVASGPAADGAGDRACGPACGVVGSVVVACWSAPTESCVDDAARIGRAQGRRALRKGLH